MKKIVVLTGAGMSAESGIATFRAADGLWENHKIEDVASPMGWMKNRNLVLNFYNQRRKQLKEVEPNEGHHALAALDADFEVNIITQNVDNLHERAKSKNILHLHGELTKVRSEIHEDLIYHWEEDLNIGDLCERGTQLRPHIVWFGEDVPLILKANEITAKADILIIIGTSLNVYPANNLLSAVGNNVPIYFIDPKPNFDFIRNYPNLTILETTATEGLKNLVKKLKNV
jgi:NAD-dependent deacetylase